MCQSAKQIMYSWRKYFWCIQNEEYLILFLQFSNISNSCSSFAIAIVEALDIFGAFWYRFFTLGPASNSCCSFSFSKKKRNVKENLLQTPLRLRKSDDFKESNKEKKIKNNTFIGSNREKFNIAITIIEQ